MWPGGQPATIWVWGCWTNVHGMYETTYTTTGSAMRQAAIQTTGSPSSQPGRSQPAAGSPGGSSRRMGSSGAGGAASGPKPQRPPIQYSPTTTSEPKASASATSNGVTDTDPSLIVVSSLPLASAPKKTIAPRAAGAPAPKRISSSVQAIGWTTATTTASSVSPTMISRNVRFPNPGSVEPAAAGTLIAM